MTTLTHGLSGHTNFKRWNNIIQRCYNPNHRSFKSYGGSGVRVEWIWHHENLDGVKNFLVWLDYELDKYFAKFPENKGKQIEIGRKRITANYGPDNCEIRLFGETTRIRRTAALTLEMVIAMRKYKRYQDPKVSHNELIKHFGLKDVTVATISRALTGASWECANSIEPPLAGEFNAPKQTRAADYPMPELMMPA